MLGPGQASVLAGAHTAINAPIRIAFSSTKKRYHGDIDGSDGIESRRCL